MEPASSIIGRLPFQLHAIYLLQAIIAGYLLSRLMKFAWCPRRRRRRVRRVKNYTPAQRVERMFRFSFEDLAEDLTDYDHTLNRATLFNTVRNIHISDEGLSEKSNLLNLKKKKSVRINTETNIIYDRVITPESFKYPTEWSTGDTSPALWPDIDSFLGVN